MPTSAGFFLWETRVRLKSELPENAKKTSKKTEENEQENRDQNARAAGPIDKLSLNMPRPERKLTGPSTGRGERNDTSARPVERCGRTGYFGARADRRTTQSRLDFQRTLLICNAGHFP
jgi:hypothetical protein